MTGLTIDDYRRLLAELRGGIERRVSGERQLEAFAAEENERSSLEFDEQLVSLADETEREIAAVDSRHENDRRELTQRHQAMTTAAEAEFQRIVARATQSYDSELQTVEQQYAENTWMLSSLLDDDAENSPKRQYDLLNEQLQQSREHLTAQWEQLKSRFAGTIERLEARRQRTDADVEPATESRTRSEAVERFEAAERTVRSGIAQLERQKLPRLFVGGNVVLLGLLMWGGLFVAAWFLLDPRSIGSQGITPAAHVMLSAGGSFVVTFLAMMTAWGIATSRTDRVFRPVQQGMADAQAQYQAWFRLAKEELQRSERQFRERHEALVEKRDRSFQQFAGEREQRMRELRERRDREIREPERNRDSLLHEASLALNRDLLSSETTHRRETTALRTRLEHEQERLRQEWTTQQTARQRRQEALWKETSEDWQTCLTKLRREVDVAASASRATFPAWSRILEDDWRAADVIPDGIRLGDWSFDLADLPQGMPADGRLKPESTAVVLPAVLPFPDPPTLVVNAAGEGRTATVSLLQTAMLRFLTMLPPGKVRFTVIDPVGLGEQFSAFMHLADFDELLISGRIWTEPARIEQQLGDLTEHMENVFQKYLRNEFETIEEYNLHAGEIAEPYRVLVVANFPHGFSERAAQRLTSIAASGRRCGVFALVGVDTKQPRPHGFDPANLEEEALVLNWDQGGFTTGALAPARWRFTSDLPPRPPEFSAIVRRLGERSKNVRRVEVPFHRVAPPADRYWTDDSRQSIDAPLGRSGATRLQHLRLGTGTSQHVLVAGKTGSGKSTLLHILVTNLALRYAPSEVEFYLIDFKKGVEFKAYATRQLPHARVIAIESDREFGVSVLERLDAILKSRGDRFRDAGVQDVAAFRNACPNEPMPRILLIVDEFQEFFTEEDRHSQTASLLLDRLVRQGRAFGIHVLLGSQTLGGAYSLARTTIGQMAVRIALQCSDADASLILSEDNAAARLLTRPGEAIYNDANGMVDGNSPFQIAWLADDERDAYLDKIRKLADRRNVETPPAVVFEGNIPADPSQNPALIRRLAIACTTEPAFDETTAAVSTWIGDSVALTGPTEIEFRSQAGTNLLIVGQDRNAVTGILTAGLIGLASSGFSADAPAFYIFSGDDSPPVVDAWDAALGSIPQSHKRAGVDRAGPLMNELSDELARRKSSEGGRHAPVFLLIDDLGRFRELRRGDDDFGFGGFDRERELTTAQRFAEVLRDGPSHGIHTVAWCDSYSNVDRWLGRALLREFEMRVVFQISATDSSHLLDSPAASRLGTNRALLYRDDRGTLEKFRPYGPPTDAWLDEVRRSFQPDSSPSRDQPSSRDRPSSEPSSSESSSTDQPDDLDIDEWIIV